MKPDEPKRVSAKAGPEPTAVASKTGPEPNDVGRSFSLRVERHATKALWRLRETEVHNGKKRENFTQWAASPDFWPQLLPANGRLRDFLFGEVAHNPPQQARSGGA